MAAFGCRHHRACLSHYDRLGLIIVISGHSSRIFNAETPNYSSHYFNEYQVNELKVFAHHFPIETFDAHHVVYDKIIPERHFT